MPYHFGEGLCKTENELAQLKSVGIFMPIGHLMDSVANVTILSNMMVECDVRGMTYLACNWKEWMSHHEDCAPDIVLAFAEAESANSDSKFASHWKSFTEYSRQL